MGEIESQYDLEIFTFTFYSLLITFIKIHDYHPKFSQTLVKFY